jgi:methionyl-tRNA synthetase
MPEKFYITTTLPYINSEPHIGFAGEIIQADVLARFHRRLGDEVFFNTGTDEHGLKIFRKAEELGIGIPSIVLFEPRTRSTLKRRRSFGKDAKRAEIFIKKITR